MRIKLVYISGGDVFAPSDIKSALDEIRKALSLPDDIVLFGLPVDEMDDNAVPKIAQPAKAAPNVSDHKILQFPDARRKSILNVIGSPAIAAEEADAGISDTPLVVSDSDNDDADESSITELLDELPSMMEDEAPKQSALVEEFGEFLDNDKPEPEKAPAKKPKPFGRKGKNPFNNLLGDLFSYAGIAANDDVQDFTLPDFIKRP